ncbi:transposase [Streptomyces sp. NPDC096311]|uniref:transposase n=1 Tax=Streptomyces sp. NPDC096311 TaxID=3366083 RepID=UPI0038204AA7
MVDWRGRPRPLGAGDVAVRCRIDFKYALGLELEDPGFHHSVLSDFRDRLADGDRADRLLGLARTRIRRAGLLKGRGTQRTDSTHILSAARELTRLELVTEAVRAVLEAMAHHAPEVLDELVTAEWAERYGRPVRLCSQPRHPVARLAQVGADARELLGRLHVRFPGAPSRRRPRCSGRSWCSTSWSTGVAGSGRAPSAMAGRRRGCGRLSRVRSSGHHGPLM